MIIQKKNKSNLQVKSLKIILNKLNGIKRRKIFLIILNILKISPELK